MRIAPAAFRRRRCRRCRRPVPTRRQSVERDARASRNSTLRPPRPSPFRVTVVSPPDSSTQGGGSGWLRGHEQAIPAITLPTSAPHPRARRPAATGDPRGSGDLCRRFQRTLRGRDHQVVYPGQPRVAWFRGLLASRGSSDGGRLPVARCGNVQGPSGHRRRCWGRGQSGPRRSLQGRRPARRRSAGSPLLAGWAAAAKTAAFDCRKMASDHGKLKRLIRPTLGFQSMRRPGRRSRASR